jgi:NAD(P)-dependent dehydrogenase (short-subunit alcohol dehydrogenase family)
VSGNQPASGAGGRLVVVTGAGAGIGRAVAERFVTLGDLVVVVDIDGDAARSTAEALSGTERRALPLATDVADPAAVASAIRELMQQLGPVDVLCNNAGVMDGFAPVAAVTDAVWERVLAVNLSGPFHMARAVLPAMVKRGRGAVVNIASVAGLVGGRAGAAYTASKHGLIGLTRSIAWHYGDRNIRANAVCPGPIVTNIGNDRHDHHEGRSRAEGLLALRLRQGRPEEIAQVVTFLCSEDAGFVNGAIVSADGGWTAG